ncbi:hypothetical protein BDM02DRAFT_3112340 [Thelephora ganbajun]|uniref:Uncharacterized protein n=1 Tax=Thelephora ganbajun TaxID=370292 RepID=A0ACB6ZLK9_THEGA|nr:hypothetical protein BDM02DRAFT_3112340 [Thelephora ganbajun]
MGSSRGHLDYPAHTLTQVILSVFQMPYPLSSRCEVPMEDPTNRGFCRPLPIDLFPIPVLPEMPREGQSTCTFNCLRMCFIRICSSWNDGVGQGEGSPGERMGQNAVQSHQGKGRFENDHPTKR